MQITTSKFWTKETIKLSGTETDPSIGLDCLIDYNHDKWDYTTIIKFEQICHNLVKKQLI